MKAHNIASLLLLGLTACEHTTPFTPGTYVPGGPFGTGNPLRFTYNPGVDERPVWLPDGKMFLYTEERIDLPNSEHCLAALPAAGGSIQREICASPVAVADSLIAFESPAVTSDGQMAFVRLSAAQTPSPVVGGGIMVGVLTSPSTATPVVSFPFFGPTGRPVDRASNIHWAGPSSLWFVGERWTVLTCRMCASDTVRWGEEIDRVTFSGGAPVISFLAGTDQASSLAMAGTDTMYYTLNGDSRIHRRILSTNIDSVVYDFGTIGIARDVSVAEGRIAAVVGGHITFAYDSAHATMIQVDHGGALHVLLAGVDILLSDSTTIVTRRPALAPDGRSVVAEIRPAASLGPPALPLSPTDLWRWTLPAVSSFPEKS